MPCRRRGVDLSRSLSLARRARSDRYDIDTFYGDSCRALCCVPCSHYQVWEYLNEAKVGEPGLRTPLIEPPAPAPEPAPVAESSPMAR